MAGMIYHSLGMEFTSPFINTWVGTSADDYIKFLKDPDSYLNSEPEFIHDGKKDYPRAYIGDIKIGFRHYRSESEALDAYNRRKTRIKRQRIWVIIYAPEGIEKEDYDFLLAAGYKNIAVLADKDLVKYYATDLLSFAGDCHEWYSKDKYGMRVYEKYFDYVDFLNKNS